MRVRRAIWCLSVLSIAVFAAVESHAVCLDPKNPDEYQYPGLEQEFEASSAVIVGTVMSVYPVKDPADWDGFDAFYYSVRVDSQFKGKDPSSILMRAWNDSGGYRMGVGETHLLFLTSVGSHFEANICGNSGILTKGQDTLHRLQNMSKTGEHAD